MQQVQVQFDLDAWILFARGDEHLYWDEVFGHELSWTLDRIESASGLVPTDGPPTTRAVTYRAIAAVLAAGLDDPLGWQVRPVLIGPEADRDDDVLAAFSGGAGVVDAIERDIEEQVDRDGEVLFFEPLWALWHGGKPVLLLDSTRAKVFSTDWSTVELLGENAPRSRRCDGRGPAGPGRGDRVEPAAHRQQDLGLSGDSWTLADFERGLDAHLAKISAAKQPPGETSTWLRTAAQVADQIVAGASFGRVVTHLHLHPRTVAPVWTALAGRATATPAAVEVDDESELCPIHPRHLVPRAWALASDVALRVDGARVEVDAVSMPRVVDDSGRALVTFTADDITLTGCQTSP